MPPRRRKAPIEYSGKLVYPFPVSMHHRHARPDPKGTYAFVEPHNQSIENARGWRKAYLEWGRKGHRGQIDAAEMIHRNLRDAAHQSNFFMKTVSKRTRRIRERLKAAGVRVEEPMEIDLKNGKELFARGENMPLLLSHYGIGRSPLHDCRYAIAQIIRMIVRMHAAGIVHGHPHINNFVVDKKGRVTMIDLGMARYYARQPRNAKEFIRRYAIDLQRVGFAMAQLMHEVPGTKWHLVEVNALDTAGHIIDRILKQYKKVGIKTFNVSARELLLAGHN